MIRIGGTVANSGHPRTKATEPQSAADSRLTSYRDRFTSCAATIRGSRGGAALLKAATRWTPYLVVIGDETLSHRVAEAIGVDPPQRHWVRPQESRRQSADAPRVGPSADLDSAVQARDIADILEIQQTGVIDLVVIDPHAIGSLESLPSELVRPFKSADGRDPAVILVARKSVGPRRIEMCDVLFGPIVEMLGAPADVGLKTLRNAIREGCARRSGYYLGETISRRCYVRETADTFRTTGAVPDGISTEDRSPFVDALTTVCFQPHLVDSVDRLAAYARNMRWQKPSEGGGPLTMKPDFMTGDRRRLERLMHSIGLPSPGNFLDAVRVAYAYWLLRVDLPGPSLSMHDVGQRVGFIWDDTDRKLDTGGGIPPKKAWKVRTPRKTEQDATTKTLLKVTRRLTGVAPIVLRDLLTSYDALDFFGLLALRDVWQSDRVWLWENGFTRPAQ